MGGKNLETGGRGIVAPHRVPRGKLIAQYRMPMSFCFYPTLYLPNHLYYFEAWQFLKRTKWYIYLGYIQRPLNQLNVSLWWRHNIYLWRYNGARRHTCTKYYKYFMLENCTQTTNVYWSKNTIALLYIYTWQNNPRLTLSIFLKFSYIIRCLLYQSVPHHLRCYYYVSASPIILRIVKFFHTFVDSCIGTICHHKVFTGRVVLWENFISPRNNFFHAKKDFFLARYRFPNGSQSFRWKILEPRGQYSTLNPMAWKPWISHGYRTQVWDKISFILLLCIINEIPRNTDPSPYKFLPNH